MNIYELETIARQRVAESARNARRAQPVEIDGRDETPHHRWHLHWHRQAARVA